MTGVQTCALPIYLLEKVPGYQIDPDIIATHWLNPTEIQSHPRLSPRSDLVFQAINLYNSGQRLPLESLVFTR